MVESCALEIQYVHIEDVKGRFVFVEKYQTFRV